MRPKWPKLISLAQNLLHSSFSSLVQSLLPRDNLFTNILVFDSTFRGHTHFVDV